MANISQIQPVVESCFASRDATPLLHMLGFESDPLAIPSIPGCVLHGARGTLAAYCISAAETASADLMRIARLVRAHNHAQLQLYVIVSADFKRMIVASFGLGDHLLTLPLDRDKLHASDIETLFDMIPVDGEKGSALASRHAHALDRAHVTRRFFSDFAAQRDQVAAAWIGPASQARREREQLALLLLSRLMFLYFLQHRDHLGGDRNYLIRRVHTWQRSPKRSGSFYRTTLVPLFFSVLNRRRDKRPRQAQQFGDLPYLNGGLFERHVLERKYRGLDIEDDVIFAVFKQLLERYRFTARDPADSQIDGVHDVGVDAEMLGRVFEGLMAAKTRESTGTFYTPAATVDRLVTDALHAYLAPSLGERSTTLMLREANVDGLQPDQRVYAAKMLRNATVIDPACGSGAFLLGSMSRLAQTRSLLDSGDEMKARRDAVARNLYGVDLQSDAAQLCALRLWLALVPDNNRQEVQPLPNLDRQIRQGDSLVDPIDLRSGVTDAAVRRGISELTNAAALYVHSEPETRTGLQRSLLRSEHRLARAWVSALQRRMQNQLVELRTLAAQKDLFGQRTSEAHMADNEISVVRQRTAELERLARSIKLQDERPFFSFGVHFADAAVKGFDVVICNPPWVRSHHWSAGMTAVVRRRFEVCRASPWRPPYHATAPAAGGKQTDLALLFLERALELLAPGGVLAVIMPAKFMRSLSGASARRMLFTYTEIVSIEDHSLDQRSIFQADAFASLIVARKSAPPLQQRTSITAIHRTSKPAAYDLQQRQLPLIDGDPASPWLIVPPDVRRALRKMQEGMLIGADTRLQVRRGVVTGSNHATVLTCAVPKLSGLCEIRAEGHTTAVRAADFEGIIEENVVAPLVRGCDVSAWSSRRERWIICRTGDTTNHPRATSFLTRHNCAMPVLHIPANATLLAWHDLASTIKAVVLPRRTVPLNTVYFIPLDEDVAFLLCAYFNSLPVRTYARAIAERAKDAHFRFFAWTMSLLPLPAVWRKQEARRLMELARAAHESGAVSDDARLEIDAIVTRAYDLGKSDVRAIREFDEWLRGQ